MRKVFFVFAVLFACASGCGQSNRDGLGADGGAGNNPVLETPYFATAERRDQVLGAYGSVKEGMTEAEVIRILGRPDERNPTYEPKPKYPKTIGMSLVYVLQRMKEYGSVNEMDEKLVRVHFDLMGKVTRVDANGIPE